MKTKTIKQLEKKEVKKEKKVRSTVIKAFAGRNKQNVKKLEKANKADNKTENDLVEAITRSVILNKKMLNKEKDNLKKWQESYFQELYFEFKNLVEKYNNGLQVKAETLTNKIADLKIERRRLQDDVRELETKKKVLVNG